MARGTNLFSLTRSYRQSRCWLPLLALAGLNVCGAAARADELHLADGRVITGRVTQDGEEYVVSFDGGASSRYPAAEVLRLDRIPTARERYNNLKAVTSADDYDAQMELGKWCRVNLLPEEAKAHFTRAVELRPQDSSARKAAGYVYFDGKWVTREEQLTLQGKAIYEGREMTIAEAQALKQKAEEQKRQSEGFSKAWKLLRSASEDHTAQDLQNIQKQLQEMGELAMGAVLRCASDGNPKVRNICLDLLGGDTTEDSRKELFARLRYEEIPELVRKAAQLLAKRPEKEAIIKQTLDLCIKASGEVTRQRSWLVLRYLADKRVIPVLIDAVEFSPIAEDPNKDNKKAPPKGWQSSADVKEPDKKPYYPACEALNYLTGAEIFVNKEEWVKWWKKNSETFDFKKHNSKADPSASKAEKDKQKPASGAKNASDDTQKSKTEPGDKK